MLPVLQSAYSYCYQTGVLCSFFGLLIPIMIGYFLDEMATGVIIGSLFWLVAWSIAKQRQEERLAESATAGDRMQKLEQELSC